MGQDLYRLEPERCALMVVDIQENLMKVINGREAVENNSVLLLKTAKTLGVSVVATTQYAARIGEFVAPVREELRDVQVIDKMEFGCFSNQSVRRAVENLPNRVDTLVVCGVETHICIYQTVLGGLMEGYRMWVVADAVSSRTKGNHEIGLARMRDMGAVIGSTEMVAYEWLGRAGTPQFKALLPLFK